MIDIDIDKKKTSPYHRNPTDLLENGNEKVQKKDICNEKVEGHDNGSNSTAVFIILWSLEFCSSTVDCH